MLARGLCLLLLLQMGLGVLGEESAVDSNTTNDDSNLELTEKSEAEEYLAVAEPEVDVNDRAAEADEKVEERSEGADEKVEERAENVDEVVEENVEEVEARSEEVDDNVEEEMDDELDFEDRSADVLKNYFLKNEERLNNAEAEIKKLKSQMIRCESGLEVTKSPNGIWGQVKSYTFRRVNFKKPFVGTPTMVIGVRKAVDDASLQPIWAHVWYEQVTNKGFRMSYLLRPTNLKVHAKTYAMVYWMACGH